ncbi:YciI family protein [bacterium]|nr:YciI family protein [bacterium]
MKYLLLVYGEEGLLNEDEMQKCYQESTRVCEKLDQKGQFLGASPLQPVALATSVRVREGRRLVTDGPFAETREQLGGYFLVEAGDLDEAIEIAAQIPGAGWGTVEIRPVVEQAGLPRK